MRFSNEKIKGQMIEMSTAMIGETFASVWPSTFYDFCFVSSSESEIKIAHVIKNITPT